MRKILIIILFFCVNCIIYSQQLTLKKIGEIPAYYQQLNSLKIKLSTDNIEIDNSNQNVFSEAIEGVKIFETSPGKYYFLVANFNSSGQDNFDNISIIVFDEEGNVLNKLELNSSSQTQPLFAVNDEGIVSAFNPDKFELIIFKGTSKSRISLGNDLSAGNIKTSFIAMNDNNVYVLSSLVPFNMGSGQAKANLYKINISNRTVTKKNVDYSIPLLLQIEDNALIISGIKINNSAAQANISMIDNNMEIISETNLAADKIVKYNTDYFIKYGSAMYRLDKNFNKVREYFFTNNERVEDFTLEGDNLFVLTKKDYLYNIYNLSNSFKLNAEAAVNIPGNSFKSLSSNGDVLYIHTDNKTFLYE